MECSQMKKSKSYSLIDSEFNGHFLALDEPVNVTRELSSYGEQ